MPFRVSRLRRWFALGAILMVATVAGMYFYARWSVRKAIHDVPAKMGLEIQQTAEGFSISKSEQGRTQFKVSASKAVQFKEGGRAELHDVKIVVYGKDGSRFDQIAGMISSTIPFRQRDREGSSADRPGVESRGRAAFGQSAPKKPELHFTLKPTASSSTRIRGRFVHGQGRISNAAGIWFCMGIQYEAKTGTMNLLSAVDMTVNRPQPVHLNADHGVITKQPHQVVLTTVHMTRAQQESRSDQATFFLRDDNTVDRVLARATWRPTFMASRKCTRVPTAPRCG